MSSFLSAVLVSSLVESERKVWWNPPFSPVRGCWYRISSCNVSGCSMLMVLNNHLSGPRTRWPWVTARMLSPFDCRLRPRLKA